jgi:hypothetical protein
MKRVSHVAIVALLAALPSVCEEKKGDKFAKTPPQVHAAGPTHAVAAPPPQGAPANPPANNSEAAKNNNSGPKLAPPNNPVERLMAMPPEWRERILEKMPPLQQANLRERLANFDKLPPEERARRYRLLSAFTSLPPEKQLLVTRQIQAFNNLPEARRDVLAPVVQRLRGLPENERRTLLESEDYKSRYAASEIQMMSDIAMNFPLPGR